MAHEIEGRRSQKGSSELIIAASDPRVQHILATLNAKLGVSMNLNDLSPVPANPDPGKFSYLVLVLAKIMSGDLVRANNINLYVDLKKMRNADGVKTPKGDYWLWMQGGLLYKGKCVNDAIKFFSARERGGTYKEGLFQYTYYSELLDECYMDFAGSRSASGSVPYLSRWYDRLRLDASRPGSALSYYGSVSAGVSLDS